MKNFRHIWKTEGTMSLHMVTEELQATYGQLSFTFNFSLTWTLTPQDYSEARPGVT
jgi:hypothetical protein